MSLATESNRHMTMNNYLVYLFLLQLVANLSIGCEILPNQASFCEIPIGRHTMYNGDKCNYNVQRYHGFLDVYCQHIQNKDQIQSSFTFDVDNIIYHSTIPSVKIELHQAKQMTHYMNAYNKQIFYHDQFVYNECCTKMKYDDSNLNTPHGLVFYIH